MAPKKSTAIVPAGSSSSRFRSTEHATYYRKLLEEKITISRTLDESRLRYKVLHFFTPSSLSNLLQLDFPFHKDLIYEVYANMEIPFSRDRIVSRVLTRDIEITRDDFHKYLGLSLTGESVHSSISDGGFNWGEANLLLRGSPLDSHVATLDGLKESARIVQHILRCSIFPKYGDKTAITPVHSLCTFFILKGKRFDEVDALIRYIENTMTVRLAHVKRKQNLVLGHLLAYLLFSKYQIRSPRNPDAPTSFYSDASFHILFSKRPRPASAAAGGEQEGATESAHTEAPRPMSRGESSTSRETTFDFTSFQAHMDSRLDHVDSRLTHLDSRFDRLELTQTEILEQLAWVRSRMEGPPDHPTDGDDF